MTGIRDDRNHCGVQPVTAIVHPSAFPEHWRDDYLASFRARQMAHRFHYESPKQATRWLAVHEAHSPARTDRSVLDTYDQAFAELAQTFRHEPIQLISLGCGGGQKDLALLQQLQAQNQTAAPSYVPCDISLSLTLTAHQRIAAALPAIPSQPVVLDLSHATRINTALPSTTSRRLFAFFGMLPNFEPAQILPPLANLLRPNDRLLLSANLSPGPDYAGGLLKILPGYDNALTRQWLITALTDAGLEASADQIQFRIADVGNLKRIEAWFQFPSDQQVAIETEPFRFRAGENFRLFYSYRHTPALLAQLLAPHRLQIQTHWLAPNHEEALFLCAPSP